MQLRPLRELFENHAAMSYIEPNPCSDWNHVLDAVDGGERIMIVLRQMLAVTPAGMVVRYGPCVLMSVDELQCHLKCLTSSAKPRHRRSLSAYEVELTSRNCYRRLSSSSTPPLSSATQMARSIDRTWKVKSYSLSGGCRTRPISKRNSLSRH